MPTTTTPTKSAPAQSAPTPTLGLVLDTVLRDMVADAKNAAILLSKHHRAFDGEVSCQSVIRRVESILYDASVALENVAASMSAETKQKLDTPRSLEIKHREWR